MIMYIYLKISEKARHNNYVLILMGNSLWPVGVMLSHCMRKTGNPHQAYETN